LLIYNEMVHPAGFEPVTPAFGGQSGTAGRVDSERRKSALSHDSHGLCWILQKTLKNVWCWLELIQLGTKTKFDMPPNDL